MHDTMPGLLSLLTPGLAFVYFLPTIVALIRRHTHVIGIFWINLIFGWTVFGWVITQIWSFTNDPANDNLKRGIAVRILQIFIVCYSLIAFIFLAVIHRPLNPNDSSKAETQTQPQATPAPQTGIPAPADEIIGK